MDHLEDVSVSAYLRSHPEFLQEWLERNAEPQLLENVQKKWEEQQENKSENDHSSPVELTTSQPSLLVPGQPGEGYVLGAN